MSMQIPNSHTNHPEPNSTVEEDQGRNSKSPILVSKISTIKFGTSPRPFILLPKNPTLTSDILDNIINWIIPYSQLVIYLPRIYIHLHHLIFFSFSLNRDDFQDDKDNAKKVWKHMSFEDKHMYDQLLTCNNVLHDILWENYRYRKLRKEDCDYVYTKHGRLEEYSPTFFKPISRNRNHQSMINNLPSYPTISTHSLLSNNKKVSKERKNFKFPNSHSSKDSNMTLGTSNHSLPSSNCDFPLYMPSDLFILPSNDESSEDPNYHDFSPLSPRMILNPPIVPSNDKDHKISLYDI
ncbi:16997_t:CDS:2 [Acaulospora colombiana]|uniref:16997_t:CDS:1 n=1 Tax=Acaulospora colombiana TaxID=27376 RepID=A0ACA9L5D8_9GLOM|nr:16997_t:CDS:2 [Acaulospora colombiana]